VEIAIPSVSTRLGKSTLDGLQFWADDLARWAARALAGKNTSSESTNSQATTRAPSLLVGSRYFAGRTASSVGDDETTNSALEIKLNIDDGT
jgi:autophagy-related protein 2